MPPRPITGAIIDKDCVALLLGGDGRIPSYTEAMETPETWRLGFSLLDAAAHAEIGSEEGQALAAVVAQLDEWYSSRYGQPLIPGGKETMA